MNWTHISREILFLSFVVIRTGKRSPGWSILRVIPKTSQHFCSHMKKTQLVWTTKGFYLRTRHITKITPSVTEYRVRPFTQNGSTLDTLDCKHISTNINAFSSWNSGFSGQICSMICLSTASVFHILSTVFKLQLKTTYKQHFRI